MSEFGKLQPRCFTTGAREFARLPVAERQRIAAELGLDEDPAWPLTGWALQEWTLGIARRAKARRKWAPFDWAVRVARSTQVGEAVIG